MNLVTFWALGYAEIIVKSLEQMLKYIKNSYRLQTYVTKSI